jgi:fatty acid desaturase
LTIDAFQNRRFDHQSLFSLFVYDLFDHVSFFNNAFGGVPDMSVLQLIYFCTWWGAVSLLAGLGENGGPIGWRFLLLWHTARCTVSYVSYIFRELIDHSGLPSDTIITFTRTLPCCNLFQMFLQPHDDNYHLLHHLLPKVPMAQMHNLHLWLVDNIPEYEKANRE